MFYSHMIYEKTNQVGLCHSKNLRQYVNKKVKLFFNKTLFTKIDSALGHNPMS